MEHRHWHEPRSLAVVVERQIRVMEASLHPINFFHMPVPKSSVERADVGLENYLSPLRDLLPLVQRHGTDVYLGLIHEYNPDLTKEMIDAVRKVVPELDFGVATECGGGRMDWPAFESALQIAAEVSEPSTTIGKLDQAETSSARYLHERAAYEDGQTTKAGAERSVL